MYSVSKYILLLFITFILICYLINPCNADEESDEISRDEKLKSVIRKMCNLTMGPVKRASHQSKVETLHKLERKLKKTFNKLNLRNEKNMDFLLQGLKVMILNNDFRICPKGYPDLRPMVPYRNMTSVPLATVRPDNVNNDTIENETIHNDTRRTLHNNITLTNRKPIKQKLLREIVHKMEQVARKFLANATTENQKTKALARIRKRVEKALMKRHLITRSKDHNSYTDLIMEGIEMMREKEDARRMALLIHTKREDDPNGQRHDKIIKAKILDYVNARAQDRNISQEAATKSGQDLLTTVPDCEHMHDKVCKSLDTLNNFICLYDKTKVSIEKVCDGEMDCPDSSDEKDCAKTAIAKVHNAIDILADVDHSRYCFTALVDNTIFSNQGRLLGDLLETEINFINKYAGVNDTPPEKVIIEQLNSRSLKDVSNDINVIIRTFYMALHGAFCINPKQEFEEMFNRIDNEAYHEENKYKEDPMLWTPSTCTCHGKNCVNGTCSMSCRRVCYHKYTLPRWQCDAVSGEQTVPYAALCNGKFECYDESDELDCAREMSPMKYESAAIYEAILRTIKMKTILFEYQPARKSLLQLYNTIKTVHKLAMRHNKDLEIYKEVRDKAFTLFVRVYNDLVSGLVSMQHVEYAYTFMHEMAREYMVALKRSKSGNDVIPVPEECLCKNWVCAQTKCTPKCIFTCSVKPKLTQYACLVDGATSYIDSSLICNGKKDCPNGDDEKNCNVDACRIHHFVVISHHLKKVSENGMGTFVGELVKSWINKVLDRLAEAEKRDRPTRLDIVLLINESLRDLMDTYSSLSTYRKNEHRDELVLKEFVLLAQYLLESTKMCGVPQHHASGTKITS